MVDYLNQNQGVVAAFAGAVMAVLTLVYVLATIWLVRYSQRQAELTQHSIDLLREAERNRYRPYAIFDIVWEDGIASAVIKNAGASPALNVKITVQPKLEWVDEKRAVSFIETGIAYLVPGRELSEPFSWTEEFHKSYAPYQFTGNVTYADAAGVKYDDPFRIDIAYTQRMTSIGKPDTPGDIEKIRKALEVLASEEFQPLVRTIDQKDYKQYREEYQRKRSVAAFQRIKAMAQVSEPVVPQQPVSVPVESTPEKKPESGA